GMALEAKVAAGEEVRVGDVEGGGEEAAGIDHAGGTDEDALGVDEVDLPVGAEGAVDGTGIAAEDAVESGAGGGGLDEAGGGAGGDGEVLPVDDGAVAELFDRQGGAVDGNAGLAGDDLPARGMGLGGEGKGEGGEERRGDQAPPRTPGAQVEKRGARARRVSLPATRR